MDVPPHAIPPTVVTKFKKSDWGMNFQFLDDLADSDWYGWLKRLAHMSKQRF